MKRLLILAALALAVSVSPAWACDGVQVQKTNPVTGGIERVCQVWDGHDYEIYWYEKTSGSWSPGTPLTSNDADDVVPHLAFDSSGNTAVVWRESGDEGQIWYRGRKTSSGGGSWQSEPVAVSEVDHDASAPWVTFHADVPRVGWHEYETAGSVGVLAAGGNGADPWPTSFASERIASTFYSGDLQLEVRSKEGTLWMVWVDSSTHLGYSVWDAGAESWGAPQDEPYDGADDIDAGKQRIEDAVTD